MEIIPQEKPVTYLGLTPKEVSQYSVTRALNQLSNQQRSGFEFELSDTIAKKLKGSTSGLFVPADVQHAKRDLSATLGTQPTNGGGLLSSGTNPQGSFIDSLRANSIVMNLGAQFLSGLVGNIGIPRQGTSATGYWVGEGNAPDASQQGFESLPASPKTVSGVTPFTRSLLLQSTPSVDRLLMSDLAKALGRAITAAVIAGAGADDPTGILNASGVVDATTGSANGVDFNHGDAVDVETAIRNADVLGQLSWLLNPDVSGTLKKRLKIAGSDVPCYLVQDGRMNNNPVQETTQMPAQAGILGDFSEIIICEWGVLELLLNPFGVGFRAGNYEIRAIQSIDIIVRHPEAFKKFEAFS